MKKQYLQILMCLSLLLIVVVVWSTRSANKQVKSDVENLSTSTLIQVEPDIEAADVFIDSTVLEAIGEPQEPQEAHGNSSEIDSIDTTLPDLNQLLPVWLLNDGDLFQDRREINGHTVLRTRGRYEWENGSALEIEITDLGANPDEPLMKSLGFNPDHGDVDAESGFTLTHDEEWYVMNQEYDYNDEAGSLQLVIDGRYLIEIQIQELPQDAFQEILDADIPYDEIFDRLDRD